MMAGMSIDMFIEPGQDPRAEPPGQGSELATLTGFLNYYRQTLELKCAGLDAAALAARSVAPSKMSLLGLVRHLSDVERNWFRRFMAGQDAQDRFSSSEDIDGDWDGARADPAVVDEAWRAWREEGAFAEQFVAAGPGLDLPGRRGAGRGPAGRGGGRGARGTAAARGAAPHGGGVSPPHRPRRPDPRAHRRR